MQAAIDALQMMDWAMAFTDAPRIKSSFTEMPTHTNAIMYSLVATAKANGLDPYEYLVELYTKVPNIKSSSELKALMPWSIKKDKLDFQIAA